MHLWKAFNFRFVFGTVTGVRQMALRCHLPTSAFVRAFATMLFSASQLGEGSNDADAY